jgi:hypothetical protein
MSTPDDCQRVKGFNRVKFITRGSKASWKIPAAQLQSVLLRAYLGTLDAGAFVPPVLTEGVPVLSVGTTGAPVGLVGETFGLAEVLGLVFTVPGTMAFAFGVLAVACGKPADAEGLL